MNSYKLRLWTVWSMKMMLCNGIQAKALHIRYKMNMWYFHLDLSVTNLTLAAQVIKKWCDYSCWRVLSWEYESSISIWKLGHSKKIVQGHLKNCMVFVDECMVLSCCYLGIWPCDLEGERSRLFQGHNHICPKHTVNHVSKLSILTFFQGQSH